jgi:hypothetical protein
VIRRKFDYGRIKKASEGRQLAAASNLKEEADYLVADGSFRSLGESLEALCSINRKQYRLREAD